jgi:hypothetical protein
LIQWTFDETSGNTADSVGDNHGTLLNWAREEVDGWPSWRR